MKKQTIGILLGGILLVAGLVALAVLLERPQRTGGDSSQRVVINEAARTLLYLPVYHAHAQGYFKQAGLDVHIVTGGTATGSVAAMLTGDADFAVADPMNVPISREKGSRARVVAQVVGRIAFWGLGRDVAIQSLTPETLKGKKIATHPRPMSGYTYTVALIRQLGLRPDEDVEIIGSQPGTELAPLFNGQADFALTVEPSVSKALAQGAHIVYSYPRATGDQVLSAMITREDFLEQRRETVRAVVAAVQRAMRDILSDPTRAATSAKSYFPQLDEATLAAAVRRLVTEQVIPDSILMSEDSWSRAVQARIDVGDLKRASPRAENCAMDIMEEVSRRP